MQDVQQSLQAASRSERNQSELAYRLRVKEAFAASADTCFTDKTARGTAQSGRGLNDFCTLSQIAHQVLQKGTKLQGFAPGLFPSCKASLLLRPLHELPVYHITSLGSEPSSRDKRSRMFISLLQERSNLTDSVM
jgi:hypothetical protein